MNITDLNTIEMNQALAYVLGLIYPLYKEKKIGEKEYILGSINHNHNMITSEELAEHFSSVNRLIEAYMKETKPEIKSNSSSEFNISHKEGFTILIDRTDIDSQNSIEILNSLANKIKESNDEIKKCLCVDVLMGEHLLTPLRSIYPLMLIEIMRNKI